CETASKLKQQHRDAEAQRESELKSNSLCLCVKIIFDSFETACCKGRGFGAVINRKFNNA
ncbi:MAG: hypothetical protein ABI528_06200, partial [bacterium]